MSLAAQGDVIIVDTEGGNDLSEIAVLDSKGKLIYEAFVAEHPKNKFVRVNLKPLLDILREFQHLAEGKTIICHYAEHDRQTLQNSFRKVQLPLPRLKFACTCEMAHQTYPQSRSFSLEFLSKQLNLKVNGKYFNPAQAHTARYDAAFTHQLYLSLTQQTRLQPMSNVPSQISNPFSSSRVDNPFQDHIDFGGVYQQEFQTLKAVLADIKADPNLQSKGAVVIGEAGSGKTHLMMRLAKELLRTNRLLFIRQPNNAETVLYHTYARILESFAEKVPGRERTQLELLIANSFIEILKTIDRVTSTQKGQALLAALEKDSLSLFTHLGNEGTQKHREYWNYIEQHISEWWTGRYSSAGYSTEILKGIIKFCTYTEPGRKELVRRWLAGNELEPAEADLIGLRNWQEDLSREEFALEAITVFAKLSTLDQPLIIIFDQLEGLGLAHNAPILASFGDAVKEILTHVPNSLIILNLFPDRWQQFRHYFDGSVVDRVSQYIVWLNRPSEESLKRILSLKAEAVGLSLTQLFSGANLEDILQQKSIRAVLNRASQYFRGQVEQNPLPTPQVSQNSSLESRVEQLEQMLSQVVSLIAPLLNSDSGLQPIRTVGIDESLHPIVPTKVISRPQPVTVSTSIPVCQEIEDYLFQQRAHLDMAYGKPTIINDGDDIGKLQAIVEAFKSLRPLEVDHLRLGRSKLPEHLVIKTPSHQVVIGFLSASGTAFTARLKNLNQLVISERDFEFRLWRDAREPEITGKVGRQEIEKLNYTLNGRFAVMSQQERVNFELLYQLIIDIQEQDLDTTLAEALPALHTVLKDDELFSLLALN